MSKSFKPRKKKDKESRYKAKDGRSSKKRNTRPFSRRKGSSSFKLSNTYEFIFKTTHRNVA